MSRIPRRASTPSAIHRRCCRFADARCLRLAWREKSKHRFGPGKPLDHHCRGHSLGVSARRSRHRRRTPDRRSHRGSAPTPAFRRSSHFGAREIARSTSRSNHGCRLVTASDALASALLDRLNPIPSPESQRCMSICLLAYSENSDSSASGPLPRRSSAAALRPRCRAFVAPAIRRTPGIHRSGPCCRRPDHLFQREPHAGLPAAAMAAQWPAIPPPITSINRFVSMMQLLRRNQPWALPRHAEPLDERVQHPPEALVAGIPL